MYIIFVIILIITIPIVFTNVPKVEETSSDSIENQYEKANYGNLSKIKLLHSDTNEIEEIDFDEYLYGVVSAEMPASYDFAALQAQAIVARTYTAFQILNNPKHENANICDNPNCCQAWITKQNRFARWGEENSVIYWEKITSAVNSTSGKIIVYNNQPINAFFHANSGGKTELPIYVWGGAYPYLQSVETSGEENYSSYYSEVTISKDELIQKMLEKYSNFKIDFNSENSIKILENTESNRVKKIQIGNIELSGVDARKIFNLKSAMFNIELSNDSIIFHVNGYGHGVGLSQSGSDSLAKQGYSYEEIIHHYFANVDIISYSEQ